MAVDKIKLIGEYKNKQGFKKRKEKSSLLNKYSII